jgi:hypothetical protein
MPQAINQFLAYTLNNWNKAPDYVLLFGDSTMNPRQLNCQSACPANFNNHETNYVPTAIAFKDRFQGAIPSDTPHVLVVGNDLMPDFAIGRIPAQTSLQAQTVVNKIILYETSRLTPEPWHNNILFLADQDDDSGNTFCTENHRLADQFPENFTTVVDPLCMPENPSEAQVSAIRTQLLTESLQGASILNYRGHGAVQDWGQGVRFMNQEDSSWWLNANKPFVLISADCLDGYFALPGNNALSESFLKDTTAGSAAHWSSSGLGFTFEHTVLEENFYQYVFDNEEETIGASIQHAKQAYLNSIYHTSLIYSFNLQGDPAMVMFGATNHPIYLPIIQK